MSIFSEQMCIRDRYGREIEGGAGILLDIPLDHSKELKGLTLETLSLSLIHISAGSWQTALFRVFTRSRLLRHAGYVEKYR